MNEQTAILVEPGVAKVCFWPGCIQANPASWISPRCPGACERPLLAESGRLVGRGAPAVLTFALDTKLTYT